MHYSVISKSFIVCIICTVLLSCQSESHNGVGSLEVSAAYFDSLRETYLPVTRARILLFRSSAEGVFCATTGSNYRKSDAETHPIFYYSYPILNRDEIKTETKLQIDELKGRLRTNKLSGSNEIFLKIEDRIVYLSTDGMDSFGEGLKDFTDRDNYWPWVNKSVYNKDESFYVNKVHGKRLKPLKDGIWKLEIDPSQPIPNYSFVEYDIEGRVGSRGIASLTSIPAGEYLLKVVNLRNDTFSCKHIKIKPNQTLTLYKTFGKRSEATNGYEDWE